MLQWLGTTVNFYEVYPHLDSYTTMGENLCSDKAATQPLCVKGYAMASGLNEKELNKVSQRIQLSKFYKKSYPEML